MPTTKIDRLRQTFNRLDVDRNGEIPLRDLRVVINDPDDTAIDLGLTHDQLQTLLAAADDDNNGALDFREFVYLTTGKPSSRYRRTLYNVANVVTPYDAQPEVHSYLDKYRCCPPPFFILLITIAQIAVFVYYTIDSSKTPNWMTGCAGCFIGNEPGPLIFAPSLRNEAWRFLSYQFLHAGLQHIGGNVIMQVLLGIPLELVHKFWRVAPLYLIAVVSGAMVQYFIDPTVLLVGASGGVYALITAHLANTILNWSEMPMRWVRLILVLAFVGVDFGSAIYRRFASDECGGTVSVAAHIGGAVTGLLLGLVLLRNIRVHKWEKAVSWIGCAVYVVLFLIGVVLVWVIPPGGKGLGELIDKC